MNDADAAQDEVSSNREPSTYRLVIRAEIIPNELPPAAPAGSYRRTPALLVSAAAVLVLGGLGWILFADDAPPQAARAELRDTAIRPPATTPVPPTTQSEIATPTLAAADTALPGGTSAPNAPSRSTTTAAAAAAEDSGPPTAIKKVTPEPPRSALATIRGTVRVAIAVTIGSDGAVIAARSQDPGPSRYFERLSREAAQQWTFAPATSEEQRSMLLRFHFTQGGVKAWAEPVA